MNITTITENKTNIAIILSNENLITNAQSALDLIMTVEYGTKSNRIIINKDNICEDFFILSTGIAGEILQKFINYGFKIAIYGDYSKYTSKPLKDFIYESNSGKNIFFVNTQEEAIKKLKQTL
ncbi:MAG TPA: DUF4180 domain-containing protein [Candidatus Dwaynia gallinarum]|nr:DUF4180 domain-containing protein [Candidatus Dwaynia gallinarum]